MKKLLEKSQIQSLLLYLLQYFTIFKNNKKKELLDDWKKIKLFIFWYPSRTQIVTFWWGEKGCEYLGMCDYLQALQYFLYLKN